MTKDEHDSGPYPVKPQVCCDMDLAHKYWKRHPVFGIGKVCNTAYLPGERCPNTHHHITRTGS